MKRTEENKLIKILVTGGADKIGSRVVGSCNEIFNSLALLTKFPCRAQYRTAEFGDKCHNYLDVITAKRNFGWFPVLSLEEDLKKQFLISKHWSVSHDHSSDPAAR